MELPALLDRLEEAGGPAGPVPSVGLRPLRHRR